MLNVKYFTKKKFLFLTQQDSLYPSIKKWVYYIEILNTFVKSKLFVWIIANKRLKVYFIQIKYEPVTI
jgi:hypothetical protein